MPRSPLPTRRSSKAVSRFCPEARLRIPTTRWSAPASKSPRFNCLMDEQSSIVMMSRGSYLNLSLGQPAPQAAVRQD